MPIAERGIVGRGVLLDIARFRGKPSLERAETFDHRDLMECARAQGVEILPRQHPARPHRLGRRTVGGQTDGRRRLLGARPDLQPRPGALVRRDADPLPGHRHAGQRDHLRARNRPHAGAARSTDAQSRRRLHRDGLARRRWPPTAPPTASYEGFYCASPAKVSKRHRRLGKSSVHQIVQHGR